MQWFFYLRLLLGGCLFCLPLLAHSGQLFPSSQPAQLLCTIRGQSFVNNTEYFGKIMEGETIFGFHFLPSITLLMAHDMGLQLGGIWEKHFGHMHPWEGIRPTLSIYYSHAQTTCVVGIFSLQDYPVTLLEPIYFVRKPFMEGLHVKLEKNKSYLSGWLNWLTLLSKKEEIPETFTCHLDGAWVCSSQRVSCTIPFQLAVYHLGGQGIAVKDYSLWCGGSGLSLRLSNRLGSSIHGSSYLLLNRYVKAVDRPFKAGWGQLHTIDWRMSVLGVSLSYWYGHNFSSENMGYPLYQSIQIADHQVVYHECIRSLLFLSIYGHWMPCSGITIQAAFRPYYDCKNRLLEYGFSSALVYSRKIQLMALDYADG